GAGGGGRRGARRRLREAEGAPAGGTGSALLAHVEHEGVLLEDVAVLLRDAVLQLLDLRALELDDPAGVDVDHVVVVAAAVQLVDGGAALEVVLEHQAGGLELRQDAVDRGEPDLVAALEQLPVDVLGRQVMVRGRLLEQLQDAHPGVGDLQPGLAQFVRFHGSPVQVRLGVARCRGPVAAARRVYHRGMSALPWPPMRTLIVPALAALLVTGCGLIYRQPVYQGSLVSPEDVAQLQVGMSRQQVAALLGTPSIQDPFHHDRWDYAATERVGRAGQPTVHNFVVYFENDAVVRWEGSHFPDRDKELIGNVRRQFGPNLPRDDRSRRRR